MRSDRPPSGSAEPPPWAAGTWLTGSASLTDDQYLSMVDWMRRRLTAVCVVVALAPVMAVHASRSTTSAQSITAATGTRMAADPVVKDSALFVSMEVDGSTAWPGMSASFIVACDRPVGGGDFFPGLRVSGPPGSGFEVDLPVHSTFLSSAYFIWQIPADQPPGHYTALPWCDGPVGDGDPDVIFPDGVNGPSTPFVVRPLVLREDAALFVSIAFPPAGSPGATVRFLVTCDRSVQEGHSVSLWIDGPYTTGFPSDDPVRVGSTFYADWTIPADQPARDYIVHASCDGSSDVIEPVIWPPGVAGPPMPFTVLPAGLPSAL